MTDYGMEEVDSSWAAKLKRLGGGSVCVYGRD